jgi:hypothetical protein
MDTTQSLNLSIVHESDVHSVEIKLTMNYYIGIKTGLDYSSRVIDKSKSRVLMIRRRLMQYFIIMKD